MEHPIAFTSALFVAVTGLCAWGNDVLDWKHKLLVYVIYWVLPSIAVFWAYH